MTLYINDKEVWNTTDNKYFDILSNCFLLKKSKKIIKSKVTDYANKLNLVTFTSTRDFRINPTIFQAPLKL